MTDNLELKMDAYLPLRNVVYQTLRTAILTGELQPGERLMELQLADRLGVSRTPIREAIHMLEKEGLAKIVPRKGAHVAKMTEKDLMDVLMIRQTLEDLALLTACDMIDDEGLEELEKAMLLFEACTRQDDVVRTAQADVAFHDVIYKAADNPKLLDILNNLREQMYRYRVEYLKDSSVFPQLVKEHRQMYNAIIKKDKEAAAACLYKHLHNQAMAVREIIRQQE